MKENSRVESTNNVEKMNKVSVYESSRKIIDIVKDTPHFT